MSVEENFDICTKLQIVFPCSSSSNSILTYPLLRMSVEENFDICTKLQIVFPCSIIAFAKVDPHPQIYPPQSIFG